MPFYLNGLINSVLNGDAENLRGGEHDLCLLGCALFYLCGIISDETKFNRIDRCLTIFYHCW